MDKSIKYESQFMPGELSVINVHVENNFKQFIDFRKII